MSTAIAVPNELAHRLDDAEMVRTLKETVCKGATDAQFRLFVEVCKATGLNPFLREVWFVPGVGVMAGRDGYLAAANRHPMFDGIETLVERDAQGIPIKATCKVWRKDRSHPTTCEAYYNEYKKASGVWTTYKSAMIGKVAEVLALKRSFSINGVVTEEELGEQKSNGSREEQQTVAAEIIEAQAQEMAEVKAAPTKAPLQPKMLKAFGEMKGLLGESDYYRILKSHGYEKSNQIPDPDAGKVVYKAMKAYLEASEPFTRLEQRDKARFDDILESEGCLSIAEALAHADSAGILLRTELAMSVPKKPKTAADTLAELEVSHSDIVWRVAGNHGIGNKEELQRVSPATMDKLIALIGAEIEDTK